MRIDRLELKNFKKYAEQTFEFPRAHDSQPGNGSFHVLIGDNGSGKTSILDAAAVALGVWLEHVPDSLLNSSRRRLTADQKRLVAIEQGDRMQFQKVLETTSIRATGTILDSVNKTWVQSLNVGETKVSKAGKEDVLPLIWSAYERIHRGELLTLPVLCYYGAGRTWRAHNERRKLKNGLANKWEAYYDCLNDRIRTGDLTPWFRSEHIAMGNRQGRYRPGFEAVRRAICDCVPGAERIWYDGDLEEIVLSIEGNSQPFGNLSAGQRGLLALVADLAIKMVTLNNYLVPPGALGIEDEPLPRVLAQTPGVVLIDELDVHLHPSWQRIIVEKLRTTFPSIQFITTTHSPQIIGEVPSCEIIVLADGGSSTPLRTFGIDSSRILEETMDSPARNSMVDSLLKNLFALVDREDFDEARKALAEVEAKLGEDDPEVTRARSLMAFLESPP